MESFEGKYINLVDHGEFVHLTCKVGYVSLEIMEEMIRERLEFTNFRDVYMFCDVTKVTAVNKQARDHLSAGQGSVKLKGMAVFVNSTLTKVLANFIIKVCYKDSPVPIRIFSSNEEAVDWLKELRKLETARVS
jgi:hypothetical protein